MSTVYICVVGCCSARVCAVQESRSPRRILAETMTLPQQTLVALMYVAPVMDVLQLLHKEAAPPPPIVPGVNLVRKLTGQSVS